MTYDKNAKAENTGNNELPISKISIKAAYSCVLDWAARLTASTVAGIVIAEALEPRAS